jgi:hypothetical protein
MSSVSVTPDCPAFGAVLTESSKSYVQLAERVTPLLVYDNAVTLLLNHCTEWLRH